MAQDLIDPSDPLATDTELIDNALEVLTEIRFNLADEEGRISIVIDTDPEWLDASLEYVRTVLEALKERLIEE
jgi:hypothetical protein